MKNSNESASHASPVPPVQKRLTIEEFTLLAIDKLVMGKYKSIHTVYSGFNHAFREYFPGMDPIAETKALVEAGKISHRTCRGGALIGKPGAIKVDVSSKAVLKKMGL